jgi:phosphomannomutase
VTGLPAHVEAAARAWMDQDPDLATQSELEGLLAEAAAGDRSAVEETEDRFAGRLRFGTAGLRGVVAAGPNRMNRAVVRTATAALVAWLSRHVPGSREAGVVVGCDARHGSTAFLEEVTLVLSGAGFRAHVLEPQGPTPLLAFAVPHLAAAAGVMITASHNPPRDNGYKLYLGDGAQIVPPTDSEIEALMDEVGPLSAVPTGDPHGPLVTRHGPEVASAFLEALARESPAPASAGDLRIVYTPLHGVALATFSSALERAGFPPAVVVAEQAAPDPEFPTVAFPNPEEPGALDLALAEARRVSADVVVANDPDGDRLAVAVPSADREGGWRVLTGDELGCLLGAYVLDRTAAGPEPASRLVATTVVSSSMLSKIAAGAGARYAETLTGFKWVARAAGSLPGSRLVFGYEEALGYTIGTVVRDKDGVGAALAFLGLVAGARSQGRTVPDLLDDLEIRHGVHLTAQLSVRSPEPAAAMWRLRASQPASFAGRPVASVRDLSLPDPGPGALPVSDVLIYRFDDARLVVRPSGTEPKFKAYLEVVRPVAGAGTHPLAAARAAAAAEMEELKEAVAPLLAT